jgi:hypothetical protein
MKRFITVGALAVIAAFAAAGPASAAEPEVIWLNSHDSDDGHYAGPVTSDALEAGTWYVAEVKGTFSFYAKKVWKDPESAAPWTSVCGLPDSEPFYGPDDAGPTGMDAEVVFARPCYERDGAMWPKPGHWSNFQVLINGTWHHPTAFGGAWPAQDYNNAYRYPFLGAGKTLRFRLVDWPGTADNYGKLRITIRTADATDCVNGDWDDAWTQLGFATKDECLNTLPPAGD